MCHDGWDISDARALCGILGFSQCKLILAIYLAYNNKITALHCGNTCFGKSTLPRGIGHITCREQQRTCTWNAYTSACGQDAGLVCSEFGYARGGNSNHALNITACHYPAGKMMNVECPLPTQISPTCPTTTRTHPATNTVEMSTTVGSLGGDMVGGAQSAESCDSCPSLAALGGGLGVLCAILALLLVGVVVGWVWSCHRRIGKQER